MVPTPTRILRSRSGRATAPTAGDVLAIVLVRRDGWTLAAPRHLAGHARRLWAGEWRCEYELRAGSWHVQAL
jgi:hypothetical protein